MKAVILIHGFLTNYLDFAPIIPYLEKEYDYVSKYIVPGHDIPPNYKLFRVKDTFDTLLKTYDELKKDYKDIDVIGFSMGGALASYLQSVREVSKLVLLSPANKYLNFSLLHNRLQFRHLLNTISDKQEKELNKEIFNNNDKVAMKMMLKELLPNYNIHNLKTFMDIVKICNKELLAITCPSLIIWGKLDQLVPYSSVKYLYDISLNKKELVIYDDISHLMLLSENNQKIIDKIMYFLKDDINE